MFLVWHHQVKSHQKPRTYPQRTFIRVGAIRSCPIRIWNLLHFRGFSLRLEIKCLRTWFLWKELLGTFIWDLQGKPFYSCLSLPLLQLYYAWPQYFFALAISLSQFLLIQPARILSLCWSASLLQLEAIFSLLLTSEVSYSSWIPHLVLFWLLTAPPGISFVPIIFYYLWWPTPNGIIVSPLKFLFRFPLYFVVSNPKSFSLHYRNLDIC